MDLAAGSLEAYQQFQHGLARDLPNIFPKGGTRHRIPSGRMSSESNNPQRTLGTLFALQLAVHGSDPGGRDQPTPALPQV